MPFFVSLSNVGFHSHQVFCLIDEPFYLVNGGFNHLCCLTHVLSDQFHLPVIFFCFIAFCEPLICFQKSDPKELQFVEFFQNSTIHQVWEILWGLWKVNFSISYHIDLTRPCWWICSYSKVQIFIDSLLFKEFLIKSSQNVIIIK